MGRRIVFAGGLQTLALAKVYRAEVAGPIGDDVSFIGSGAAGTDAARAQILLADLVAMEVDEDGDCLAAADLPAGGEVVRIPNLYADFLWPFAGRAHPRNRGAFALPGGPYPGELGDRFLDQMVAEGVPEDEAIGRYLAIDMVEQGELDSRLADRLAILEKLDQAAGYDLAGFIAENFREERLFATRQRLTMPLVQRLLQQFLGKLGVRGWRAEQLRRVPFPSGGLPVHPGVIAHFDLAWTGPEARYPVNEEGYFTFADYCRRYMRFAWNEALHRGIAAALSDPQAAIADLEDGLRESPDSSLGHQALHAARRAAGLEDGNPAEWVIEEDCHDPLAGAILAGLDQDVAAEEAEAGLEAPLAEAEEAAPEAETAALAVPESPAAGALAGDAPIDDADASIDAGDLAPVVEEAAAPERNQPNGMPVARFGAPARPAGMPAAEPEPLPHGFTQFHRPGSQEDGEEAGAAPGDDLIDVLPALLPVFTDVASTVDRPYATMPEIMPPPPLRPILPPELAGEEAKPGLIARLLGKGQRH
jgi:hypothetical protein